MTEKTILLSHSLGPNTPLYGGAKDISVIPDKCIEEGHSCNSLKVSFPNHASTHIDMPKHFIAGGKSLTDVAAEFWVFGKVAVWNRPADNGELIGPMVASDKALGEDSAVELLLIRTGFESKRGASEYWEKGPGLGLGLAASLRQRFARLRGVGVDFISISSYQNREVGREVHREFLGREIVLIEDMKLSVLDTKAAPKSALVSPLLIENGDGAPVTVFAFY